MSDLFSHSFSQLRWRFIQPAMMALDTSHIWLALVGIASFYVLRSIYRLYFHPLSGIPGPKLAAVTHLYEFYYDVIIHGRFLFQIEKMHQQYGRQGEI